MHPYLIESRHRRATKGGQEPEMAEEKKRREMARVQERGKKKKRKWTGRAKINNSQDAAGRKQMAAGLRGLSGPWQKPVTHITWHYSGWGYRKMSADA